MPAWHTGELVQGWLLHFWSRSPPVCLGKQQQMVEELRPLLLTVGDLDWDLGFWVSLFWAWAIYGCSNHLGNKHVDERSLFCLFLFCHSVFQITNLSFFLKKYSIKRILFLKKWKVPWSWGWAWERGRKEGGGRGLLRILRVCSADCYL